MKTPMTPEEAREAIQAWLADAAPRGETTTVRVIRTLMAYIEHLEARIENLEQAKKKEEP